MPDYERYEYFAHIGAINGQKTVVPISRLPEPDENVEDWLREECDIARVRDTVAGLLHFSGMSELVMVGFHRSVKEGFTFDPPPPPERPGNLGPEGIESFISLTPDLPEPPLGGPSPPDVSPGGPPLEFIEEFMTHVEDLIRAACWAAAQNPGSTQAIKIKSKPRPGSEAGGPGIQLEADADLEGADEQ
jgi:hypothetical protein